MERKINAEPEIITIGLSQEYTPKAWEARVRELIEDCGMTRREAESEANSQKIELELYYEEGYGLFAVEVEAAENLDGFSSPYTKITYESEAE